MGIKLRLLRLMVFCGLAPLMIYDWLYPLLTPEQRQAYISEFVRLAKTQECGYPPTGQGSVVGHGSEAAIMRDMISACIAIYDEFPDMYEVSAGRFFRVAAKGQSAFRHDRASGSRWLCGALPFSRHGSRGGPLGGKPGGQRGVDGVRRERRRRRRLVRGPRGHVGAHARRPPGPQVSRIHSRS
jgi:hypothetical protein